MKIISLQAENVKRLHAIDVKLDGTLQVIGGNNAQGKTSVLDAIWLTLGGGNASRDTDQPIRDGQQAASATVTLDDLIITRTWTSDGKTNIKVTTPDGAAYKSPQTMLNELVASVGIDPLAFVRMDDKTQRDTLLALVDLPFDPTQLAAERQRLYDDRRDINRAVRQYDGQLAGYDDDEPVESVDVAALARHHADLSHIAQRRDTLARDTDALRSKIADTENYLAAMRANLEATESELAGLDDPADELDDVQEQMREAEDTNRRAAAQIGRNNTRVLRDKAQEESDNLTLHINALDKRKADGLAAANMPTPELGFDDNGVTLNGLPFKQASSAEQIRASIAMGIALNPKLRTLFIRDGSLLDADSMTAIAEQAAAADYQIIMERVGNTDPGAIIIHDGHVA